MRFVKGPQQQSLTRRRKGSQLHLWHRGHAWPLLVGSHHSFLRTTLVGRLKLVVGWVCIPSCLFLENCGVEKKKFLSWGASFPATSARPSAQSSVRLHWPMLLQVYAANELGRWGDPTPTSSDSTVRCGFSELSCFRFHHWNGSLTFHAACKLSMTFFFFPFLYWQEALGSHCGVWQQGTCLESFAADTGLLDWGACLPWCPLHGAGRRRCKEGLWWGASSSELSLRGGMQWIALWCFARHALIFKAVWGGCHWMALISW